MRRILGSLIAVLLCCSGTVWANPKPPKDPDHNALQNIIPVSSSGGQFETVQEALAYLSTVDPAPAVDNRYIIQIGPGIYEGRVAMMEWVNIEGSGQDVTVVTSEGNDYFLESYNVLGADNAVLSRMTIENTGGDAAYGIGVYCDGTSPVLRDLRIVAFGATSGARGILLSDSDAVVEDLIVEASGGTSAVALISNYGAPDLNGVELHAANATDTNAAMLIGFGDDVVRIADSRFQAGTGGEYSATGLGVDRSTGVYLNNVELLASAFQTSWALKLSSETPDVMLKDCRLTARGGVVSDAVFDSGSTPEPQVRRIMDSSLHGDRSSIYIQNANEFYIGASQLSGPVTSWMGGTGRCVVSYDAMFEALDENCVSSSPPTPTPTPTTTPTYFPPTSTPTPLTSTPTPTPTPSSTMTPTYSPPTLTPTPTPTLTPTPTMTPT